MGLWDGWELSLLHVASLEIGGRLKIGGHESPPTAALLVLWSEDDDFGAIMHCDWEWCFVWERETTRHGSGHTWQPSQPETSSLCVASWVGSDPEHLEVAGLSDSGTLHWAAFHFGDGNLDLVAANVATNETGYLETGYLAATIVRPGLVAGVTRSRIDWFRSGASKFTLRSSTDMAIPSTVACFPSRRTSELIVVCRDGFISRVPIPC